MKLPPVRHLCQLICIALAPASVWAATQVNSASDLTPDQIGEFVTISGHTTHFRAPSNDRSPYWFRMRDSSGTEIRAVAWPDVLKSVSHWQALATTGTSITLTAEVADYEGTLELHVVDPTELLVQPSRAGTIPAAGLTSSSAYTATATTAPVQSNSL
jgi:hypothetical protein